MAQQWKPTQFDDQGQPMAYGWVDDSPTNLSEASGKGQLIDPKWATNDEWGNYNVDGGTAQKWRSASGARGQMVSTPNGPMFQLPEDANMNYSTTDSSANMGGLGQIGSLFSGPIGIAAGSALGAWLKGADAAFTGGVDLGGEQFADLAGDGVMSDAGGYASGAEGGNTAFDFSGSNTPMADRYLDSAGNFGQAFDVNTGGQVFNTGGMLDPSTIGANAGGGWQSGIMDTIKSGLENINKVLGMDKNPITLGDIGKTGANFLISTLMANRARDAAMQAGKMGSALDQPQRQGYQAELQSLMSNPSTFYSTNPVVQAQLAEARKQFEASSAKMGTGGTQQDAYLKNLNNIFSGTFNDQANLLSGLGGFNQGPGGGGAYASLMGQSNVMQNEAFRGFGQNIFKQQGPVQGQTGVSGLPGAATPA